MSGIWMLLLQQGVDRRFCILCCIFFNSLCNYFHFCLFKFSGSISPFSVWWLLLGQRYMSIRWINHGNLHGSVLFLLNAFLNLIIILWSESRQSFYLDHCTLTTHFLFVSSDICHLLRSALFCCSFQLERFQWQMHLYLQWLPIPSSSSCLFFYPLLLWNWMIY